MLKKCKPEEDSAHVRRLLKETFLARQANVKEGLFNTAKDIITQVPQSRFYSLVIK